MATLRDEVLHVTMLELSALHQIDNAVAEAVASRGVTRAQLAPIYRDALIAVFGKELVHEIEGRQVEIVCRELGPQHCGIVEVH